MDPWFKRCCPNHGLRDAQILLRGQSKTLKCFVLLKDDKDLVKGTVTVEKRLQNRVAGNESTTDL